MSALHEGRPQPDRSTCPGLAPKSCGFPTCEQRSALTSRELDVLRLKRDGLTLDAIAHRLGVCRHTVTNTIRDIHEKLDVSSTIEAVWVMRRELED